MACKPKRFASGGSTDRYNRKIADIESDYQKALKSGKTAGVAKAKYEQRMADAKDDLAKWTGADRTASRAAEKASEAALSEARRTKGMSIERRDSMANRMAEMDKPIEAKRPSMDDIAKSVGRMASPKPVARRVATPAPAAKRQEAPTTKKQDTSASDRVFSRLPTFGSKPATSGPVVSGGRILAPEQIAGKAQDAARARGQRPTNFAPVSAARRKQIEEAQRKGYAKGGSVDGCAVRGHTRAKRSK